MGDDYTPTVEEMREYVEMGGEYAPWDPPNSTLEEKRAAAFDRFLAKARADALRDAADTLERLETGALGDEGVEWVRVDDLYGRADLIEEGEL